MPQICPLKPLWFGIGCRRGIAQTDLEAAIQQVCRHYSLAEALIAGLATLDTKLNEPGLINLCAERHWPLYGFPADRLNRVAVPHPDARVAAKMGTASVAEAAALLAVATTQAQLLVPKQVIRTASSSLAAITLAVACPIPPAQPPALQGTR
ncbi:MAG: cobalamin biosynthesis protein [Elainella sp.]